MVNISTQSQKKTAELEKKLSSLESVEVESNVKEEAKKLSLPYVDLSSYPVNVNALFLLSEQDSRTGQCAVVEKAGQTITIAVRDPKNNQTLYILNTLKDRGFTINQVLVSEVGLENVWKRYSERQEIRFENPGILEIGEADIKSIEDIANKLSNLAVTDILESIIAAALKAGSSDIHLEPEEKSVRLRFRIDGVLRDVTNINHDTYPGVLSRIKVVSGLKLNIHDAPQDGRFTIRQNKKDTDVRVSILPGAYGENVVARILNPEAVTHKIEDLGMRPALLAETREVLKKTTGALLTTGPTGSGKTTTLYAFLEEVNNSGVKIITIEDPIEYHVQGVSQTQVDDTADYTFADGLRSIMRQDPDVILVGEIRDGETAEIAMQAALTGHFVFSTLHTNDAAGAIPRLIDLGVTPITIAPAIKAVMAQRLIRRICSACAEKKSITASDKATLEKYFKNLPDKQAIDISSISELTYPKGCDACDKSGYKGRVGVFELFTIDDEIEKLILQSPAISTVRDIAIKKGMVPMLQDGLLRVIEGMTTVDEVIRVVGT